MIEAPICCTTVHGNVVVESAFLVVILNYYDGPTSGIMQCKSCSKAYRFTMLDWDDLQDVRIYALAPLPPESFRQIVDLLSQYESPKWPSWFPLRQYSSDQIRDEVRKQLNQHLQQAGSATLVVALLEWGEPILSVRTLADSDLRDVQDWFALKDSEPPRDWFAYLGLTRKTHE